MGHRQTIFPPALERLMGLLGRQRGGAVLVVGYALCRCASHLSFQWVGPSDLSMSADAGKVVGLMLLVGLAYGRDGEHRSFKMLVAPALAALTACAVFVLAHFSPPPVPVLAAAMFLFGLGTAAMMLQWLEFVGTTSLKHIVLIIGIAEGLNSFLVIILGASLETAIYCMPLLLMLSLGLLVAYRRMVEEGCAPSLLAARRAPVGVRSIVSWRLVVWVSVYCFSYGLVSSLMDFPKLSVFDNFGNMVPGAAVAGLALGLPGRFDMRTLKNVAFVFMVSGLLLVGFFDGGNAWVQVFAGAGTASCRLFAYSLACMRAHATRTSALPACAVVKLLIIATTETGMQLGSFDLAIDHGALVGAIILAISLLSAGLSPFSIDERHVLERAAQSSPASRRREALASLSADRGLSKRETTVFMLMASGRDIAAISDELFISKSAARAHASRIYAKFAVHTRQEFNEVLDGCLPPPPPEESPEG
ncbi:LuxR family transcriptional regulator [Enterorhabdus sp. NM05_H27]|nr:LuxR family transcriptional regulator [Enterorhabdus sp. NM05_H27]